MWNASALLDLVAGLAVRMRPEVPGTAGFGFEFWLDRTDRREWHQVKYQRGASGRWSLADLQSEDVLERFRDKLQTDPGAACRFISAHAASPLDLLCARAAHAGSFDEFDGDYMNNEALRTGFEKLWRDYWKVSDEEAWRWLARRVQVRTQDWTSLDESLGLRILALVEGDERVVRQVLAQCLLDSVHKEIEVADLVQALVEAGCPPRDQGGGRGGLREQVADAGRGFISQVEEGLIAGTYLRRPEMDRVHALLDRRDPPSTILITGQQGSGKSAALADLVRRRLADGQLLTAVDIQSLSQENDTLSVGRRLGLPMAPSASLAAAANGQRAVLVLDAVDAVGTSRFTRVELLQVVSRLIRETHAHPNLSLVMTCRREDLDSDDTLRRLVSREAETEFVDIGLLSTRQAQGAIASAGGDLTALNAGQVELLRLPHLLRMFVACGDTAFENAEDLISRYTAWLLTEGS